MKLIAKSEIVAYEHIDLEDYQATIREGTEVEIGCFWNNSVGVKYLRRYDLKELEGYISYKQYEFGLKEKK